MDNEDAMMTKEQIRNICADKRRELIDKYFGNLAYEAAYEKPEEIDESRYSLELPRQIGHEYYDFMKLLLDEICPGNHKKLGEIMNKKALVLSYTADDKLQLDEAYKEAKIVTLWEKITKSNHEDVTYYKGLLKSYTEELLDWMQVDFIEDVCK